LTVDSEQLTVDSEQLTVDSERLTVDSEQLTVDSEQLTVDSDGEHLYVHLQIFKFSNPQIHQHISTSLFTPVNLLAFPETTHQSAAD
jgi:hypothetical protein